MGVLQSKIAWVTGSSRGIGAAIARLFADEGASVVVHGRDKQALASVRTQIERSGGRAIEVIADTTRFAEMELARRRIEETLGPIEILVANAGGSFTPPGPIEDTSEDGWRASVEGNLTSTFLSIKSVLPGMKARKKRKHHHAFVGRWPSTAPHGSHPVLRGQSRNRAHDAGRRRTSGPA